jgi:hypothetical protein
MERTSGASWDELADPLGVTAAEGSAPPGSTPRSARAMIGWLLGTAVAVALAESYGVDVDR